LKTQIRNNPGQSSYFGGGHRSYGKYQWNIKFYEFESNAEIEAAQSWAFGEYSYKTHSFDGINELLGRIVKASITGRSGGWFVIHADLNESELKKIDGHVKACMEALPEFLKEEREFHADLEAEAEAERARAERELLNNPKVRVALDLLNEVADDAYTLTVLGIKLK
jgi:hypothetical protein